MFRKLILPCLVCLSLVFFICCKKEVVPPQQIIQESKKGTIITFAGGGILSPDWVQVAQIPNLQSPVGVTSDINDNIYIAADNKIYQISIDGNVVKRFGTGSDKFDENGNPAISASGTARGVTVDENGNVIFCDYFYNRIRKIHLDNVTTIAGNGLMGFAGDSGQAVFGKLGGPLYITNDLKNNIFIADTWNRRIRKISSSGVLSTIAELTGRPYGICCDKAGNIYFADVDNYCIRKIDLTGSINTIAGTGVKGYSGDGGPASSAEIGSPRGICIDKQYNIYFIDWGNKRIRKINPEGEISTVAGGSESINTDRNSAEALSFMFQSPQDICVDSNGNLYVSDVNASRVFKIFMHE